MLLICISDKCTPYKDADIVFVVDVSESQDGTKLPLISDYMLDFISHFTGYPIGPEHFQFALVTFAFEAKVEFYLDTYTDNTSLTRAVEDIPQTLSCRGSSNVHLALDIIKDDVLSPGRGARSNVGKYVIVLSDGLFSKPVSAVESAERLKSDMNAKIYSVGVGEQVLNTNLIDIAQSYNHVYTTDTPDAVQSVLNEAMFGCAGNW